MANWIKLSDRYLNLDLVTEVIFVEGGLEVFQGHPDTMSFIKDPKNIEAICKRLDFCSLFIASTPHERGLIERMASGEES